MRTFYQILSLLFINLFCNISAFAQGQGAPESMNYQAVIRDGSGNVLASQAVSIRIKILQGSASGSAVYVETFTPTTNAYGSIAIQIGTGTVVSGTFNTIDWGGNTHFVETAVDISGGTNYTVISTTQFMSVPYAMYAKTAGSSPADNDWTESGSNIYRSSGNVGIGTTSPSYITDIIGTGGPRLRVKSQDGFFAGLLSENNTRQFFIGVQANYEAADGTNSGFHIFDNTAGAQRMVIDKSGNVGIGTSNPLNNLDVFSNSHTSLSVSNTSGLSRILLGNQDTGGSNNPSVISSANGALRFGGGDSWTLGGNLDINMIVSDEGNVVIGNEYATVSNGLWNNSTAQLVLGGTHNNAFNTGTKAKLVISGYDNDGSTIYPIYLEDENGNKDHYIKNAPSQSGSPTAYYRGNVGIGTETPNAKLEVSGTARITDLAGTGDRMVVADADGDLSTQAIPSGSSSTWTESGGNVYRSSGNVGIGTTSPTTNLHVEGSILVDAFSGGTGSGTKGIFFRDGFVNSNSYNSSILVYDHNSTGSTPDGLSLNGYDGVSFSTGSNSRNERMRISSDGNVGIGTETPNAKLEVSGTARITDLAGTGDRMVVADSDGDLSTQAIPSAGSSMPNGSNNGDMMYWDGSAWQTIAVGSAGAVLQIIGGVPTWVSSPDITGPTITLNGNANMNVVVGGTFTDPGATTDEGTLTTSGTVDATTVGTYTITYSATDATGNTATATRTVAVYQSQFNYTGSAQTFTVPAGVTSISVDAYGANGESTQSGYCGGYEGKGGRVQADLTVTPGEVLNIYVGGSHYYTGSGSFGGGWNGGGADGGTGGTAGGGATDIRIGGTALTDRVLVAGGGGGAYGCSSPSYPNGGDGGGLTGQTGNRKNNYAYGGVGGSQSAGGTGGAGTDGNGTWTSASNGGDGSLGNGGDGNSTRERTGGGGGGGYYGGGGGAVGRSWGWGGGGGGSSYTHPTLCSSVVHTQGAQAVSLSVAVHGSLTITIP